MTKLFPLADVLGVTTGVVVGRGGFHGIHVLIGWLIGDDTVTQIGCCAVADSCRRFLLDTFPGLPGASEAPRTEYALLEWLSQQEGRFGVTLDVPQINGG